MQREDDRDLSVIILGALLVAGAGRVWATTVKPWLTKNVGLGEGDVLITVAGLPISATDLVGVALIVLPILTLGFFLRSKLRKARAGRAQRKRLREEQPRVGG